MLEAKKNFRVAKIHFHFHNWQNLRNISTFGGYFCVFQHFYTLYDPSRVYYLHLLSRSSKYKQIYHTWILWVLQVIVISHIVNKILLYLSKFPYLPGWTAPERHAKEVWCFRGIGGSIELFDGFRPHRRLGVEKWHVFGFGGLDSWDPLMKPPILALVDLVAIYFLREKIWMTMNSLLKLMPKWCFFCLYEKPPQTALIIQVSEL